MSVVPGSVRLARPQDAAAIADVHVRAWRETYPGMLSDELLASLSVPAHERMWTAILGGTDAPGAHVAERADGTLVGFALACTPHEDDAPRDVELGMLYLLDEAKGSGLADLLVEAALLLTFEESRAQHGHGFLAVLDL